MDSPADQRIPPTEQLPVTVVIPAYNRADTIRTAVRSALEQRRYRVARVIVVDDCSADDTVARAEEAGADVVVNDSNSGAAVSRNRGLALADTEWLAFLDSDDVWRPNLLEALWPQTDGRVVVAGTAIIWVGGTPVTVVGPTSPGGRLLRSPRDIMVPENQLVISASLVRAEAARTIGGFREDLRFSEDLDFWLRLLEHGPGWSDPQLVTNYHRHAGGKSHGHVGPEQVRAAIVDSFSSRPWFDPIVRQRFLGTIHWQSFRAAMWNKQPSRALSQFSASVFPPPRAVGLAHCLIEHRRLRWRLRNEMRGTEVAGPSPAGDAR